MEDSVRYIKKFGELREKINGKTYHFVIPDYQRAYRWGKDEIEKLIFDMLEKDNQSYFIQPIIYRKEGEKYIIVDGQQRLTSIYLMLKVIKNKISPEKFLQGGKDCYIIEYENREKTKTFLENLENNATNDDTIDFFHIDLVYKRIKEIFEELNKSNENILGKQVSYEQILKVIEETCFIFYDLENKEDENNLFQRINVGKISLTNGELTKALLLNRNIYDRQLKNCDKKQEENLENNENKSIDYLVENITNQLNLAIQLDEMEQELHESDFWYMFNTTKEDEIETRIDSILEITAKQIAEKNNENKEILNRRYGIFEILESSLKKDIDDANKLAELWERIKNNFYTLKIWYEDYEIYHLIGYITHSVDSKKIYELIEKFQENDDTKDIYVKNKEEFTNYLYKIIKDNLTEKGMILNENDFRKKCMELNYNDYNNHKKIQDILLLFNILTLIKSHNKTEFGYVRGNRFSFGSYKNEEWNIEHIQSQKDPKDWEHRIATQQIELIKNNQIFNKEYYEIFDNIVNKVNNEKPEDKLKKFYEKMLSAESGNELDKPIDEEKNTLMNLTLLDANTNKKYQNAMFMIKRHIALDNERNGRFMPVCTKNIFNKYYSKNLRQQYMYWSKTDGQNYFDAMIEIFGEFNLFIKEVGK